MQIYAPPKNISKAEFRDMCLKREGDPRPAMSVFIDEFEGRLIYVKGLEVELTNVIEKKRDGLKNLFDKYEKLQKLIETLSNIIGDKERLKKALYDDEQRVRKFY